MSDLEFIESAFAARVRPEHVRDMAKPAGEIDGDADAFAGMDWRNGHNQTPGALAGEARKQTQWRPIDIRWRGQVINIGAFDEEKAPATLGRHVATSVRCLRISVPLLEGCNGERNADNPARETL